MARGKTTVRGRTALARDGQQWMLDYLIQETGKVFHFQGEGRGRLPRSVRSHDMISKHLGLQARRVEALARAESAAGHRETALAFFFDATSLYAGAQHIIFENNDEKRYLYGGLRRCYDEVIAHAPYRIEHIDIPWNGTLVSGNLHLCPDRATAPLVFYLPGCDTVKEMWPHPQFNAAHQRGMHVFCFDGPGHAESNLRGIRLTADNFERAASAALDHLVKRPEIDAGQVGVYAISLASFWGLRFAAHDRRIRAIAAPAASVAEKYFLMDLESPRWKQLFAYLTQSPTEAELDAVMAAMTLDGYMSRITCPTLLAVGEYDPRGPLDEVCRMFDQLKAPAELWVFADQHHMPSIGGGDSGTTSWAAPLHGAMCDWLRDRFADRPLRHPGQTVYVEASSAGPNSAAATLKRKWYE
jgi:dipeptidyl aminopeptidase/acylaminoacyl peptidase